MSFNGQIELNKTLVEQVAQLRAKVRTIAESKGVPIELGVDNPSSLLDKIQDNTYSVSLVQKENGAYRLTITKE